MQKKLLVAIGLFVLLVPLVLFLFYSSETQSGNSRKTLIDNSNSLIPALTPFLFQELTIPYLRSKSYESRLGEMQQVTQNSEYTSYLTSYDSDGLKINAQLTIPAGQEPNGGWPAIVFVHGYIPPAQYQTLVNYASYVDYLASAGYVILKTDLRGHAESEGEPGGAYYSSDYVIDVLNGRAALQSSDFINPDKIGLWGHSMAGNVVFRALAVSPEIPAVAVWAGAVYTYQDFRDYGIDDGSYQPPPGGTERARRRKLLFDTYGEFSQDSSFWKQVAGTNYLSDIKGAVSIHHPVDDGVVDIRYSRNLNIILDKSSVDHELKEYSSGGHNFTGETFNEAMQNTVSFFKKYLR